MQYEWIEAHLREHDMTEFYVEKQVLRLESTSFITGTSGLFIAYHTTKSKINVKPVFKSKYCPRHHPDLNMSQLCSHGHTGKVEHERIGPTIQNLMFQ